MKQNEGCSGNLDNLEEVNLANWVEHLAKAKPMTFEDKKVILLPGGPKEGVVFLTEFSFQTSLFHRKDGSIGLIEYTGERGASYDGGRTWSVLPKMELPKMESRPGEKFGFVEGYSASVAGIARLPGGLLGMTWMQTGNLPGNNTVVNCWFRTSGDDGETWSGDVLVNTGHDKGLPYFDTLCVLKSGRLIQPVRWCHYGGDHLRRTSKCVIHGKYLVELEGHGHHPEFEVAYCYFSDDGGKTWSRSKGDIIGWLYDGWGNFVPCDEPSVAQLPDGRLLMMIRTTIGRQLSAFSEDEGERWSVPEPTMLASSYAPACLKRIPKTGDLLCVWNQVSADEIRQGLHRARLSSAITSDGKSWKHFRTIDCHSGVREAARIEPEEKIQLCRSLDFIGELSKGYGVSNYPTIFFNKDEVIINYAHLRGRLPEEMVSSMKHRILPLDWFYEAP
ncbi:MAG: exo-alpha-sialidase [Candidatus Omnitrophica bacterium]|nr:exo-alpha-sialidase [Candidatus Omnitrophota bacterium]